MGHRLRAFITSLGILGGAVTLQPPPPAPLELVSDAPVCARMLPSGVVLEGPSVCLPLSLSLPLSPGRVPPVAPDPEPAP